MRLRAMTRHTGVVFWLICAASVCTISSSAQSVDQAYPTAVTENQISGRIKARDVGDPRLTTYFYTFNGRQGDLFVNVVTKNLSGGIDIFEADGMKTLTKILVYADLGPNETGRVIYLRKPEKLILRVEGRSPNDDAAEFQIKFAGSFEAAIPSTDEPPVPKVSDAALQTDSGVTVNSVGTILAVKPKPTPVPKSANAETTVAEEKRVKVKPPEEMKPEPSAEKSETETVPAEKSETAEAKPEPVVKTEAQPKTTARTKPPKASRRTRTQPAKKNEETAAKPEEAAAKPEAAPETNEPKEAKNASDTARPPKVVVTDNLPKPKADPLANVTLVILMKDGRRIERPMMDVLRFTVDHASLTIISRDGKINKFPIADVASVGIQ
jgi:hypothetical protein